MLYEQLLCCSKAELFKPGLGGLVLLEVLLHALLVLPKELVLLRLSVLLDVVQVGLQLRDYLTYPP